MFAVTEFEQLNLINEAIVEPKSVEDSGSASGFLQPGSRPSKVSKVHTKNKTKSVFSRNSTVVTTKQLDKLLDGLMQLSHDIGADNV